MLEIIVPAGEFWNEIDQEFHYTPERRLRLEHSLISISKWEARWHQAYLSRKEKTEEQILDYIRCMSIDKNVPMETFYSLSRENIKIIRAYIDEPMTATVIPKEVSEGNGGPGTKDTFTSELIYYYMISYQIPVQFEKWHLNRLLTLIHVFGMKNAPPKKRSMAQIMQSNAALNAKRRAKLGTRG